MTLYLHGPLPLQFQHVPTFCGVCLSHYYWLVEIQNSTSTYTCGRATPRAFVLLKCDRGAFARVGSCICEICHMNIYIYVEKFCFHLCGSHCHCYLSVAMMEFYLWDGFAAQCGGPLKPLYAVLCGIHSWLKSTFNLATMFMALSKKTQKPTVDCQKITLALAWWYQRNGFTWLCSCIYIPHTSWWTLVTWCIHGFSAPVPASIVALTTRRAASSVSAVTTVVLLEVLSKNAVMRQQPMQVYVPFWFKISTNYKQW